VLTVQLQAATRLVRLPAADRDAVAALSGTLASFEEGLDTPLLLDAAQALGEQVGTKGRA
jgi:hypothetical protein